MSSQIEAAVCESNFVRVFVRKIMMSCVEKFLGAESLIELRCVCSAKMCAFECLSLLRFSKFATRIYNKNSMFMFVLYNHYLC